MNPLLSAISRYFPRSQHNRGRNRTGHRKTRRTRIFLEPLEDRIVPTAISVADVVVREGPAALGTLDPAGAAAVGLDGPRDMVFNNLPGHAHYQDLFVTSANSHSVVRFDWASRTYQPFVAPNSGGLGEARGIAIGPDGNLYVGSFDQNWILQYDGTTGAFLKVFVASGAGGLGSPTGMAFGPDGNLYVSSLSSGQILKFQGPGTGPHGEQPGQSLGVFANAPGGADELAFGPDGNLYTAMSHGETPAIHDGDVMRYQGPSGPSPGQLIDTFIPTGRGGTSNPRSPVFDSQGHLYIVDIEMNEILRYQGPNEPNPGAFIDAYVTSGQSGVDWPIGFAIGPDGNFYVGDRDNDKVVHFAPTSQATFAVTLDSASASPVSVDYGTIGGTATAGSDYAQTSGTLSFAPGETAKIVAVPILDDFAGEVTETFKLTLSNAVNATIARSQAVATIQDNETKFYVVDGGIGTTYEYGSGGTSEEISVTHDINGTNTAPRGAASNAAGDKVWVVDANKTVYVYDTAGWRFGSWTAGGLNTQAQLEGIATNGTDIWLLDNKQDKVFKYAGAASRLSGSQNAASNFNLNSGNSNAKGLVTDGTSLWVVDDGSKADKVFKYNLSGTLLGSWTIDAANATPTGLTINPTNVSDIWIVDSGTKKVYQYTAAAGRTSGSQNAAATFALAAGNTNPQDIADPPTADMLLTLAASPPALNQPSAAAVIPSLTSRDAAFVSMAREPLQRAGELLRGGAITPFVDSLTPFADLAWTTAGALHGPNPLDPLTNLTPPSSPGVRSDSSAMGLRDGTLSGEASEAAATAVDSAAAGPAKESAAEE